MISLKIESSKEFEFRRVKYTLGKMEWFEKNGYKPLLPMDKSAKEFDGLADEDIKKLIDSEFNENEYKVPEKYIFEHWNLFSNSLEECLKIINKNYLSGYTIFFTKYGVAGSYHVPNSIVINIKMKFEKGMMRTICHEI